MSQPNLSKHFKAVQIRHHHVKQDEVEVLLGDDVKCSLSAVDFHHVEPATLKAAGQNVTIGGEVIDDEQLAVHLRHRLPQISTARHVPNWPSVTLRMYPARSRYISRA